MSRSFDILHREAETAGVFHSNMVTPAPAVASIRPRNHSPAAEDEITRLVQRVFIFPGTPKQPEAVAFSSVDEGAGCSWACARASEVLAEQLPGSVCIVDANLRSPSLHQHFRVEKGAGFVDAMKDLRPVREFARTTWTSNLWLITSGSVCEEPNGALNAARLRTRFSELRDEFDYVLVDTPPMNSYSDAVLLGQLMDGVIMVIGSNSTRREPARIAKENFEAARVRVLGAVLNRRTYPIPEALYRRL